MDYKKKYEDAVKKLEKFFINNDDRILYKHDIESVFPELKENKDERIRKMLIEVIKRWHECALENNVVQDIKDSGDAIAWLEKQEDANKEYWRGYREGKQEIIDKYSELEKQGEQKATLPKWKYKKDHTPLLRDSLILNKYGSVAKSPSGALVSDVWVIDYDELAKLPKEELEK